MDKKNLESLNKQITNIDSVLKMINAINKYAEIANNAMAEMLDVAKSIQEDVDKIFKEANIEVDALIKEKNEKKEK